MKPFGRYLLYSVLATLLALPVGSVMGGLAFAVFGYFVPFGVPLSFQQNLIIGLVALIPIVLLGLVPALAWGAPAYAWLAWRSHASFFRAALIGLVPGVLSMGIDRNWGMSFALLGALVGMLTHLFARWPIKAFERRSLPRRRPVESAAPAAYRYGKG